MKPFKGSMPIRQISLREFLVGFLHMTIHPHRVIDWSMNDRDSSIARYVNSDCDWGQSPAPHRAGGEQGQETSKLI